jgi:transcriptional regulator with XRE-family HTH domain
MYNMHMPDESQDRERFKFRLKIARLRRGFVTTEDAAAHFDALPKRRRITARAYKGWESGERLPGARTLYPILEEELRVDREGWLANGGGESLSELTEIFAKLDIEKRLAAKEVRQGMAAGPAMAQASAIVYQLTAKAPNFDIKASQSVPLRRIPVLSGDNFASFMAGERDAFMAGPTVIIPEHLNASADTWCWVVPKDDEAMVGPGGSYPPGTELVLDPRQDVLPGKLLVIRPAGANFWLFRRYAAGLPLSAATSFTLEAFNPAVEPIRVTNPREWELGGRLILTFNFH